MCAGRKKPAPMKTTMSASLKSVATIWKRAPKTMLRRCTSVASATMPMESASGAMPGARSAAYLAKAIAASAIGAAKPTVSESQPERKPTAG